MEWLIAALVVYWVYRLGVRAQLRRQERAAEVETSSALVIPGVLDPRIVVGIAEDNVELRKELAVLQQELGVAIVTYRSAPIMGG